MKRIYLAGPMTGLPEFNYPAFNAEAERLRALGFHVESPAENPAPVCGTWQGYMRAAITQMVTCDAVALMPGWSDSRGAIIERNLAMRLSMPTLSVSRLASAEQLNNPQFTQQSENDQWQEA